MVDNKFLLKLSQNLLEILNDEEYYDVTIEVGIDPYIKIFRAHTIILYYRSPHLQRILSTNKKKNDGTLAHVKLPNISPEIFQIVLRYIYGGKISLEECDTSDIFKILGAANELSLQELITYIQSFLIKNKTKWMEENFVSVYQTSFENNSFLELQKYCTDLISEEPDKLFKSPSFSSIPEKLLISLIQNDYLEMSEVQIWEQVIKWGVAQNSGLPPNFTDYSKDELKTLKNTLQKFIPFIRFYNLSSGEFMDKVLPYRKLLPKELYEDLLKTFLNLLNSNSKPSKKSEPRKTKHNKPKQASSQHDEPRINEEPQGSERTPLSSVGAIKSEKSEQSSLNDTNKWPYMPPLYNVKSENSEQSSSNNTRKWKPMPPPPFDPLYVKSEQSSSNNTNKWMRDLPPFNVKSEKSSSNDMNKRNPYSMLPYIPPSFNIKSEQSSSNNTNKWMPDIPPFNVKSEQSSSNDTNKWNPYIPPYIPSFNVKSEQSSSNNTNKWMPDIPPFNDKSEQSSSNDTNKRNLYISPFYNVKSEKSEKSEKRN